MAFLPLVLLSSVALFSGGSKTPSDDETANAIDAFCAHVQEVYPISRSTCTQVLDDTSIIYMDGWVNGVRSGETTRKDAHTYITVYYGPGWEHSWNNALVHELVHALLWGVYGDPDVNHGLPPGKWSDATDRWVSRVQLVLELAETAGCYFKRADGRCSPSRKTF